MTYNSVSPRQFVGGLHSCAHLTASHNQAPSPSSCLSFCIRRWSEGSFFGKSGGLDSGPPLFSSSSDQVALRSPSDLARSYIQRLQDCIYGATRILVRYILPMSTNVQTLAKSRGVLTCRFTSPFHVSRHSDRQGLPRSWSYSGRGCIRGRDWYNVGFDCITKTRYRMPFSRKRPARGAPGVPKFKHNAI
jgi:hypothetical protein